MCDILIKNGRIIDGSGTPEFPSDVAITGDKIAAVGKLDKAEAKIKIDASGLIVSPGFIDVHTHSDLALLADPQHLPKLAQGVTTELIGLDGLSYAPASPTNLKSLLFYLRALNGQPEIDYNWQTVGEFLERFEKRAVNVGFLIPHGAIRLEVMGWEGRQRRPDACPPEAGRARKDELKNMQALVRQGMKEGALGISTGLIYPPCVYAATQELIAISEAAGEFGGIYVTHLRREGEAATSPIDETLEVARRAKIPVHISHFRALGKYMGKASEMLKKIDLARDEGIKVTYDLYPYLYGNTMLSILLPLRAWDGGPEALLCRLQNKAQREEIEMALRGRADWADVRISAVASEENKALEGKSLAGIARSRGLGPEALVTRLLLEERLRVTVIFGKGEEEDTQILMRHPAMMAASDSILLGRFPHPRAYGTFPRYLGYYSRDLGLLKLEEALRKMTSFPAQTFGLSGRGRIAPGAFADITVFNPETIMDKATYENPRQLAQGIHYVIVNGQIAIEKGKPTHRLVGRLLKKI